MLSMLITSCNDVSPNLEMHIKNRILYIYIYLTEYITNSDNLKVKTHKSFQVLRHSGVLKQQLYNKLLFSNSLLGQCLLFIDPNIKKDRLHTEKHPILDLPG